MIRGVPSTLVSLVVIAGAVILAAAIVAALLTQKKQIDFPGAGGFIEGSLTRGKTAMEINLRFNATNPSCDDISFIQTATATEFGTDFYNFTRGLQWPKMCTAQKITGLLT